MSILSWRGTPKTISFRQNWHFWVLMILWAFSFEREPVVATLRARPSAGGRFQFHAATKSCHSWGSVPPFWYLGEKHEGHEGAWNQIFIDLGSILGSTPIQKPLVLHSKTDILKISIRRKRIRRPLGATRLWGVSLSHRFTFLMPCSFTNNVWNLIVLSHEVWEMVFYCPRKEGF